METESIKSGAKQRAGLIPRKEKARNCGWMFRHLCRDKGLFFFNANEYYSRESFKKAFDNSESIFDS
jgi:hypothetical protein